MQIHKKLRPGVEIVAETFGAGEPVEKHAYYKIKLRIWLRRGDPVIWKTLRGLVDHACLEDDGATLIHVSRIDRVSMIAGLFYGIQGMRIGGTRMLRVAPHLAYGAAGVPGGIPENAVLTIEVQVLSRHGGSA